MSLNMTIKSGGNGQQMENTLQGALTAFSSKKKFDIDSIWKAKTEPKCRFFARLLLHTKILTTNNLDKRGWSNDPLCKLCACELETPTHLCKDCMLTKKVWEQI
jgi:hypothetical protein